MLAVGCASTDRARKASELADLQLGGRPETWPASQVPLSITPPVLSKVTDILYGANAFHQTAHPILTWVALGTRGGSRKETKPVGMLDGRGMRGHRRLGLSLNSFFPVLFFGEKQGKAKLLTPHDISRSIKSREEGGAATCLKQSETFNKKRGWKVGVRMG